MRVPSFVVSVASRLAVCACLFLVAACDDQRASMEIRVVSDLVPEREATTVEAALHRGSANESTTSLGAAERTLRFGEPLTRGLWVASFDRVAHGTYTVWVTLRRANGAVLARRPVTASVEGDVSLTVTLTADCARVECPAAGGNPALVACIAGVCVDPKCAPEAPEYCPADLELFCNTDGDCTARTSCASVACVEGVCVHEPIASECSASEFCSGLSGCTATGEIPGAPAPGAGFCGEPCMLESAPCHYAFLACDAERNEVCEAVARRPEGAPCPGGGSCSAEGECVPGRADGGAPDAGVSDMTLAEDTSVVAADMSIVALDMDVVAADMSVVALDMDVVVTDMGVDAEADMGPPRIDSDGDRWFDDEDCDDEDPHTYPGAVELCDEKDNDCDDDIDEDVVTRLWYADADSDGFGSARSTPVASCAAVEGRVLFPTDCDDAAGTVYPGAPELCNYVDDDCNDAVDDTTEACEIGASLTVNINGYTDRIGRAWSPTDVMVSVSRALGGTLECRSGKVTGAAPGAIDGVFGECPAGAFEPVVGAGDGLYRVEVRLVYPSGLASYPSPTDYYLHGSLEGATLCDYGVTDSAIFAKARERLPNTVGGSPAFFDMTTPMTTEGAARIGTPFVRINFTPRDNARVAFGEYFGFGLGGDVWTQTDGALDVMSLRKLFVLSEEGDLLLIKRRYAAVGRTAEMLENNWWEEPLEWREARACSVMTLQTGDRGADPYPGALCDSRGPSTQGCDRSDMCDYVVLNREGAGVCLQVNGGVVEFVTPEITGIERRTGLAKLGLVDNVDNMMWRKIGAKRSPGLGVTMGRTAHISFLAENLDEFGRWVFGNYNGALYGISRVVGWRHFSPKCSGDASCAAALDALQTTDTGYLPAQYLPDVEYLRN